MKLSFPALARLALFFVLLPSLNVRGDVISDWSKTAFTYLNQTVPNSIHFQRGMAMVHVAQFDAVNAVTGRFSPYAFNHAAPDAAADAAAAQAAYSVLTNLNQANLPMLNDALAHSLSAVPEGPAKDQGIILGQAAAAAIVQLRSGDNPDLVLPEVSSTAIGKWRPTPPDLTPGILPQARYQGPWTMRSVAQFRPGPPPLMDSPAYTADYQEVQRLGSATSSTRTEEQTAAAIFQAAGVDVHNSLLCNIVTNHPLTLVESARLFALGYMAIHDAQTQVFESKYVYNYWRPVTAISNGASDGNPDTEADESWTPLLNTPPHPEYPAGHAQHSGALIGVILNILGDSFPVTVSSISTERTFPNVSTLLRETMDSRIWAGVHFRTACETGSDAGQKIARHAVENFLRPVPKLTPELSAQPGQFQLSFTSGPLLSYVVERSSDFLLWIPAQTNTYGVFQFTDPAAGENERGFYRVTVR